LSNSGRKQQLHQCSLHIFAGAVKEGARKLPPKPVVGGRRFAFIIRDLPEEWWLHRWVPGAEE